MNTADRFMQYVDQSGPNGCWIWTGAKSPLGYGRFRMFRPKRTEQAHRVSFEIRNGSIPAGMQVCHACDNPSCVNPNHLWLGTPGDNARDRDTKGRVQHGERHYAAKLTSADIAEIIKNRGFASQSELAQKFGVDRSNISLIWAGKRWKREQLRSGEGASL